MPALERRIPDGPGEPASNPEALVFKGERKGTLTARVRTNCGSTGLYRAELF